MTGGTRFPREARLLKPGEFEAVFKQALRSGDACFTVLGRRGGEETARLGLAISKKAAGNGVGRNRLKRIVRESFRRARAELPELDIVVLAKPPARTKSNAELFRSLERHWTRLIGQCNGS